MRIHFRISDTIVVIIASLMFGDVCGLVEKQRGRDRRELLFKEESENQTFDPPLPALPQMDYEVLGSSGFSITDFTQTTNFSDSTKMKTDGLSLNKESNAREEAKHQKTSTTKNSNTEIPLFSAMISQRISTRDNISSSPKEHFTIDTNASEMVTHAPVKGINDRVSQITATTYSTIDLLHKITDNSTFFNNHTKLLDKNITLKAEVSHNGSHINSSGFINRKTVLSVSENHTFAEPMNVSEVAKITRYFNSIDDIAITKRTLIQIYNIINLSRSQVETNYSSSTNNSILNCIMRVIKLLSENSTNMKLTTYKQTNNNAMNASINTFTTNNTLTPYRDISTPKTSGNVTFSGTHVVSSETLTKPYPLQTELPGTGAILSKAKTVWGLWSETTSGFTTEATEDVHFRKSNSSSTSSSAQTVPQQTLGALNEESNTIIRNTTRSDFNLSPIIFTKPIKPISTESNSSSMNSFNFTTTSTEKPQILVNISGQIRIIRGMIWMYQLNDKESAEYQYYSRKVQRMLEEMFWQTWLAKHIKKIDVHRFRRGSVMVDFRLVVKTERHIHPEEMELLFNSFLLPDGGFGGFQMDRHFTKFEIFEPVVAELSPIQLVDNSLPQWATALIVISGASLIFVILFGIVTVYGSYPIVNSQNHRRLQDEEAATGSKQNKINCTDWERRAAAAYENLSADGIYDLDEVGEKKIKDACGCKIKLENTEA